MRVGRRRPAWGLFLVAVAIMLLLLRSAVDTVRQALVWRLTMQPTVLSAEAERALAAEPGRVFRECAVGCPAMVVLPAGTAVIGEAEHRRTLTFAVPFAVGRTEITHAEWNLCVRSGACAPLSDSGFGREQRPAINVSWNEAKLYVTWLAHVTGRPYRLLGESEWEYAARAGNPSKFSFGDDSQKLGDFAWFRANSPRGPQPVAGRKPNAFGLYDMHGNVWEFVEDCFRQRPILAPGTSAIQDGRCQRRVVRGGSWDDDADFLRSAARTWYSPDNRYFILGFRVGRTLRQ